MGSYINNKTPQHHCTPSTKYLNKDHTASHISTLTLFVNKKRIYILGDSMVKHMQGLDICSKLDNKIKG